MKVYCKQSGEPPIPITVSIHWLPDGKIKPFMYWTPDGTRYEITHIYDRVRCAYLKDGGEGLRFKVRARVIETPDPDAEICNALCETYIYMADNRFCEKNIVDGRYGHAGKAFISVTMDVFPNGEYELTYFSVLGKRYHVEKPCAVEPKGSFAAGGVGLRHKVLARLVNEADDEDPNPLNPVTRMAALYWEMDKWFTAVGSA
jgi:hypothetical protein